MRAVRCLRAGLMAVVLALSSAACGAGHGAGAQRAGTLAVTGSVVSGGPLRAFNLAEVGSPGARGGRTWQQYGARPTGALLTLNPVTLYDAGAQPLVLLGIRQARSDARLHVTGQLVTVTPGFAAFSEYVSRGGPARDFGLHANFSPLRGFVLNPDPHAQMGGLSPTVVLTLRVARPGQVHIGDWLVSYRVGTATHTLSLVDDGSFCVGAGHCPSL